jgi:acetate kinase
VHDRSKLESVVAAQARTPNCGLIVMPDGFMNVHISHPQSKIALYIIPTDEEFMIARHTRSLLAA